LAGEKTAERKKKRGPGRNKRDRRVTLSHNLEEKEIALSMAGCAKKGGELLVTRLRMSYQGKVGSFEGQLMPERGVKNRGRKEIRGVASPLTSKKKLELRNTNFHTEGQSVAKIGGREKTGGVKRTRGGNQR